MRNKIRIQFFILALLLFCSRSAIAQMESQTKNIRFSVPEIALLDIEPGLSSLEFELSPGLNNGGIPTIKQIGNEGIWLNYSSAVGKNQVSRSVKAHITAGSVPEGLEIYIEASGPSIYGSANQGKSTGKTKLSYSPTSIVTDIGDCYTGNGIQKGHEIYYTMEISDIGKISQKKQAEFTVTYTLTDN